MSFNSKSCMYFTQTDILNDKINFQLFNIQLYFQYTNLITLERKLTLFNCYLKNIYQENEYGHKDEKKNSHIGVGVIKDLVLKRGLSTAKIFYTKSSQEI